MAVQDLREGEERKEMTDPSTRTCLKPDPSGARLTLDPAQGSDTATYKCRVDFEMSSTRSTLVTLTVYVVPSCLVLLDTGWSPVHGGVLRSLIEGDPLTLQCTASGSPIGVNSGELP
ncbi:uncharacterized protein LOC135107284 [Scylla paramamosain]|uniref:uncharacterized protein LOC135107284 n=1 Tax=Scylla paramamosain TaxID=85552 RepID=UPI003082F40E